MDLDDNIWQHLPLGILHTIVDYFHCSRDMKSLKNFSLVSQTFVDHCQRHLFSTIVLSNTSGTTSEEYCQRFYSLVHESPNLRPYVRMLTIEDNYPLDDTSPAISSGRLGDPGISILSNLVPLLPNLHSFSFMNLLGTGWPDFPESTRNGLLSVASRLMVQSFTISGVLQIPDEMVNHLMRKEHLEIEGCFATTQPAHSPPSPDITPIFFEDLHDTSSNSPCVKDLRLEGARAKSLCLLYNCYRPHAPILRRLEFKAYRSFVEDRDPAQWLWLLIQSQAKTIKHFSWRSSAYHGGIPPRPPPPIHLGVFSALETLHFEVDFMPPLPRNPSRNSHEAKPIFSELLPFLDQLCIPSSSTNAPALKVLMIESVFRSVEDLKAGGAAIDPGWKALDALLTPEESDSYPAFSALKEVVFFKRVFSPAPMTSPPLSMDLIRDANRALSHRLPVTRRRGVSVYFHIQLDSEWYL